MPRWKVAGFVIVLYPFDHPPLHVHVFKDGDFIGRYAIARRAWIEGPYHAGDQATKAVERWIEEQGGGAA